MIDMDRLEMLIEMVEVRSLLVLTVERYRGEQLTIAVR